MSLEEIKWYHPEGYDKWSKYDLYEPVLQHGEQTIAFKAIVKNGQIVNILSTRYYVFPNEEALKMADEVSSAVGLERFATDVSGVRTEGNALYTEDFSRMRALYIAPGEHQIDGDKVKVGVQVYNSIDGTTSFGCGLFTYRGICSNGAIFGRKDIMSTSRIHTRGLEKVLDELRYKMTQMMEKATDILEAYRAMAAVKINEEFINRITSSYIPAKVLPDYLQEDKALPDVTQWDFYNDVTEAIWHNEKTGLKTKAFQFSTLHRAIPALRVRRLT